MSETLGHFKLRLAKLPVGAKVDEELFDGFINDRIESICRAFPWTRLDKESTLQTAPEYVTGTISINAGASTGTGSGTTFTDDMSGRSIRLGQRLESYVFTFVDATHFSIDRPFEGPDNLSGATFQIWQPIYELPRELDRIKSLRNTVLGVDLDLQTRAFLDRLAPSRYFSNTTGPTLFVPAEDSANGLPQIEVYPGPTDGKGLPMSWRAKAPLFNLSDASRSRQEFPEWLSIPALFAGVKADLYDLAGDNAQATAQETIFAMRLKEMMAEDARRMPPSKMQQADRFTIHRARRANWRNGPEDDIVNWNPSN